MLLRHAIGVALRDARLRRGMTLRQLADASKVSLPYLSEIERGRKEASSEILATVSRVLGLPLSALLVETGRRLGNAEAPVLDLTARRRERTHELPASGAAASTARRDTQLLAA
ncbi:MAG TPA: helix-turn-helix transcriptional regulator [Naasia sp.]|jgi:transcriptional regulator with XRE-family HTH domain